MNSDLPPIVPRHMSKGLQPYPQPIPADVTPACQRAAVVADRWLIDNQEHPPAGWALLVMAEAEGPVDWPPLRPSAQPPPWGGALYMGPGYAIGLALVSLLAEDIREGGRRLRQSERAEKAARMLEGLSAGGYFPIYCTAPAGDVNGGSWIFGVVRTPQGMTMSRGGEA